MFQEETIADMGSPPLEREEIRVQIGCVGLADVYMYLGGAGKRLLGGTIREAEAINDGRINHMHSVSPPRCILLLRCTVPSLYLGLEIPPPVRGVSRPKTRTPS